MGLRVRVVFDDEDVEAGVYSVTVTLDDSAAACLGVHGESTLGPSLADFLAESAAPDVPVERACVIPLFTGLAKLCR